MIISEEALEKLGPDFDELCEDLVDKVDQLRIVLIELGVSPEQATNEFIFELIPNEEELAERRLINRQQNLETFNRVKGYVRKIVGETISDDGEMGLIVTKPGLVIVDFRRTFIWDERSEMILEWEKKRRIIFAECFSEKTAAEMRRHGHLIARNERELRTLATVLDPPWWDLSILQTHAQEMGAPPLERLCSWDHGNHEGRLFPLDDEAQILLLSTGAGKYQMFDAQRDLGGYRPEGIATVRVDRSGNVARLDQGSPPKRGKPFGFPWSDNDSPIGQGPKE